MKISIFDFDNTLVKLPYQEDDLYMDTVDSVNVITKINDFVFEDYLEHTDDLLILLTNRTEKLKDNVVQFLESHNIYFDMCMFRHNSHRKSKRIELFIEENLDSIESIEYWDDKERHIKDLQVLFQKYDLKYKLHLVNER